MEIVSATSAGLSTPSISMVLPNVRRAPPSVISHFSNVRCRRIRESTGTGAVKRTLLEP